MQKRQPDLRKLARRQRWLIWLVLVGLLAQFLQFVPLLSGGNRIVPFVAIIIVLQLVVWILMIVGVILVVIAHGTNPVVTVLTGLLMLAPCANILILLLVSNSVNRTFRRAGVRVGFMGVNVVDLERALDPILCKGCGYNLTGNITGICPECGRPAPRYFCTTCEKFVEGKPGEFCPGCGRVLS